ncbi:unnamed protein product, partial [Prorocentrum cordatum]
EVLAYLKKLGVDSSAIVAVGEAEKTATEAVKKKARVNEIERQREALDEELATVNGSLAKGREDLVQAQELLCTAHASLFDGPLKAMSAGLASSVAESTEGKAALEKLQQLPRAAEEAKCAADDAAAAAGASASPPGGGGERAAANDGDSGDIDMDLLGGEDFAERKQAFDTAAKELEAPKGGPQEVLDAAKRKYMAAAQAIGVKR